MRRENDKENYEGYSDSTAYHAIQNAEDYDRFRRVLGLIFSICELSGFHLEEHVVLRDRKTGKIYR